MNQVKGFIELSLPQPDLSYVRLCRDYYKINLSTLEGEVKKEVEHARNEKKKRIDIKVTRLFIDIRTIYGDDIPKYVKPKSPASIEKAKQMKQLKNEETKLMSPVKKLTLIDDEAKEVNEDEVEEDEVEEEKLDDGSQLISENYLFKDAVDLLKQLEPDQIESVIQFMSSMIYKL